MSERKVSRVDNWLSLMKFPCPEVGFSKPESSISKLDLPAPEGPVIA